MNEILIRPMTEEDIPALCQADGGETAENRECFERYLFWQEQLHDSVFLLAFLDGQLAGHLFVFYHDCPGGAEGVDLPRLADLHVYEQYRRRGVATALLKSGEKLAKTLCDRVFLTTDPAEERSHVRRLYVRRGYFPAGEEAGNLVMIKELSK